MKPLAIACTLALFICCSLYADPAATVKRVEYPN